MQFVKIYKNYHSEKKLVSYADNLDDAYDFILENEILNDTGLEICIGESKLKYTVNRTIIIDSNITTL